MPIVVLILLMVSSGFVGLLTLICLLSDLRERDFGLLAPIIFIICALIFGGSIYWMSYAWDQQTESRDVELQMCKTDIGVTQFVVVDGQFYNMNQTFGKLLPLDCSIKATRYISHNKGINWMNDQRYWFVVIQKPEEKLELKDFNNFLGQKLK